MWGEVSDSPLIVTAPHAYVLSSFVQDLRQQQGSYQPPGPSECIWSGQATSAGDFAHKAGHSTLQHGEGAQQSQAAGAQPEQRLAASFETGSRTRSLLLEKHLLAT